MSEKSEKFKVFWKTNCNLIIGFVLCVVVCVICWRDWPIHRKILGIELWKKNNINGTPNIWPGILGLGVVLFMWARNILSFNGKNRVAVLCTLLIDITVFSTFFALISNQEKDFLGSFVDGTFKMCFTVFFLAMILFGMRSIAKITVIVGLCVWGYDKFEAIGEAMGVWSYVALILFVLSLILQENINFGELKKDFCQLYSRSISGINNTLNEASNEAQRMGQVATSAASAATGVPINSMMQSSEERKG